jgi:hypothetical protein
MNTKLSIVLMFVVLAFAGLVNATTIALTAVADSDIRTTLDPLDQDYARGDRTAHVTGYKSQLTSKVYIKFALPSDFGTATSASFSIFCSKVTGTNWLVPFDMYALNNNVAGNDWKDLNHGIYTGTPDEGITWNNAPGNLAGLSFDSSKTAYLGRFTEPATSGSTVVFSNTELLNWINTDTDKVVTLMFVRRVEPGYDQFSGEGEWASRESEGPFPTLSLTYTPVPEPTTIALLALGMFGLFRKARD